MLATALSAAVTVLGYCLVLVICLWSWFYWTHRQLIREAEKLPSIFPRWPILGSALFSMGSLVDVTDQVIWAWKEGAKKRMYTWVYWAGPLPLIIVAGAEDVKKLLNTSTHQGYELENFIKDYVGFGLLTAPAEHWKVTRRHMNPVFHPRNCEQYVPVFNQNCRELVSRLSQHVDKAPVNVVPYLLDTTLKSVCQFTFGMDQDFDIQSKEFQDFLHTLESIPVMLIERIIKFWMRSDAIYRFFKRTELKSNHTKIQKFLQGHIKKGIEKYEQKKKENETINNVTESLKEKEKKYIGTDPVTVVDVYTALRETNPKITDKHLYDELVNTAMTGTDTVATAISACLVILATHQDVQEKLYKEISLVMGTEDDVSIEDMNRMPYLEQVIKETLRYIQIVPFLTRTMQEDIKLSSCTIPAGYTVYINLGGLHMDPEVYPDPEKFDPDRFAQNRSSEINDKTYIPFSRGPRGCIGKSYAQLFMRILLVHILKSFQVTTEKGYHEIKKRFAVTITSAEGIYLSFNKRR